MLSGGIIGIIPNMAGVLYGEKDYYGIRVLCKRTLKYSFVVVCIAMLFVSIFTEQVTILFGITEPVLKKEMVIALRIFILSLPFYLWNKFLISYYESIEKTTQASVITFLQNCLYVLPSALFGILLAQTLGDTGVNGLATAFICTEVLTVITAYIYRKVKYKNSDFYILPKENEGINLDISVMASLDEAVKVSQEVIEFCKENNVSLNIANLAAMALEEMTVNIIKYGGKSAKWIDINISIEENEIRLRIRDNGKPFNPAEYTFDSDEYDIHGIEIVKRISSKVDYIRTMDMNNTIIEFTKMEE